MSRSFEQLWADYLEGELDPSGIDELNSLLSADDNLLQKAADLYEDHRLLGLVHQPFDRQRFIESVTSAAARDHDEFVGSILNRVGGGQDSTSRKRPSDSTRRRMAGVSGGILAAVLIAAGFLWNSGLPDHRPGSPAIGVESARPVATLLLTEKCSWAAGGFEEGQRLSNQLLKLKSGLAVIRFDGGAELVMSGDTAVELLTSARAHLQYGEVVVRAETGADGFELKTPASPLIDLGTEFAARVDRGGTTEVHVIDGAVEYTSGQSTGVLSAGNTIRLEKSSRKIENVNWHSRSFEQILLDVNPKPQPHRMSAYEGFHYDPGILPLEDTVKGNGWSGPWRLRLPAERRLPSTEASPDHFEIVHGQLNVTWPVPGGRLGMLKMKPGNSYYVRPMKKSIDLDRDSVTYFSLMVRELERVSGKERFRERVRLTFRSLSDYFTEYISFGHGSGFQPQIRTGDGSLHVSPLLMPAEQTTLWIGKIVARADGEDEVYFRVYGEADVLGYAEPPTWHVVSRGVRLKSHFDCVLLSSEGQTSRIIDELRIGPTWRSVAPMLER